MHAGSLEALRVARPEAVDLERIKTHRRLQMRREVNDPLKQNSGSSLAIAPQRKQKSVAFASFDGCVTLPPPFNVEVNYD